MSDRPKVSVCVITYNHQRFLPRTLDSLLLQEAKFPWEVVVVDDASTDATPAILDDYAARHPERIRAYHNPRNRGPFRNFLYALHQCRGEYIAVCEGDDYWLSADKLRKQVGQLDANQDCAGSLHDAVVVNCDETVIRAGYHTPTRSRFDLAGCMCELRGHFPTCSMMFRAAVLADPLPQWFVRHPCDILLLYLVGRSGDVLFRTDRWAAYRVHEEGVWQGATSRAQRRELLLHERLISADPALWHTHGLIIGNRLQMLAHETAADAEETRWMRLRCIGLKLRYGHRDLPHLRVAFGLLWRLLLPRRAIL